MAMVCAGQRRSTTLSRALSTNARARCGTPLPGRGTWHAFRGEQLDPKAVAHTLLGGRHRRSRALTEKAHRMRRSSDYYTRPCYTHVSRTGSDDTQQTAATTARCGGHDRASPIASWPAPYSGDGRDPAQRQEGGDVHHHMDPHACCEMAAWRP
eukprot:7306602-Prymnesium_polylepis.1